VRDANGATQLTTRLMLAGGGLVLSWYGAARTTDISAQVRWLNVAVLATVGSGVANAIWLARTKHALVARRRLLTASILSAVPDPLAFNASDATNAVDAAPPRGDVTVSAPAMTRYHRARCILVEGKVVDPYVPAEEPGDGRRPCEICFSGDPT